MTKHRKDRADEIVMTIADFRMTYGYGPTVRELCERVGLASTSAVHHHLTALQRAGRVTWDPRHARTLAVTSTVIASEPGLCARPGCGKALPRERETWCSDSCRAIAYHVRSWLRAARAEDLAERIGLPI